MSAIRLQNTYVLIILTHLCSLGFGSVSLSPDPCIYAVGHRYRCVHKRSCPQEFVMSICGPGGVGVCCLIISELSPPHCGIRQRVPVSNLNYKTLQDDDEDDTTTKPFASKPTGTSKKFHRTSFSDPSSSRLPSTKRSSPASTVTKHHRRSSHRHSTRSSLRTSPKVSSPKRKTRVTLTSGSTPVSSSGSSRKSRSKFSSASSLLTTLPVDASQNRDASQTSEEVTDLETSFVSNSDHQKIFKTFTVSTELASEVGTRTDISPSRLEGSTSQRHLSTFDPSLPERLTQNIHSSMFMETSSPKGLTQQILSDTFEGFIPEEDSSMLIEEPNDPESLTQRIDSSTCKSINPDEVSGVPINPSSSESYTQEIYSNKFKGITSDANSIILTEPSSPESLTQQIYSSSFKSVDPDEVSAIPIIPSSTESNTQQIHSSTFKDITSDANSRILTDPSSPKSLIQQDHSNTFEDITLDPDSSNSPEGLNEKIYSSTITDIAEKTGISSFKGITPETLFSTFKGTSKEPISIEDTSVSDVSSTVLISDTDSESNQKDDINIYTSPASQITESHSPESKKKRDVNRMSDKKYFRHIKRSAPFASDDPDDHYTMASPSVTFSTAEPDSSTPESVVIFMDQSPEADDFFFNEEEFQLSMSEDFNRSIHDLVESLGEMQFICEYLPEAAEFLMAKANIECPEPFLDYDDDDDDPELAEYFELSKTEPDEKIKRSIRDKETEKPDMGYESGKREKKYNHTTFNTSRIELKISSDNENSMLGTAVTDEEPFSRRPTQTSNKSKNISLTLSNSYLDESEYLSLSMKEKLEEILTAEETKGLKGESLIQGNELDTKPAVTKESASFYEPNQSKRTYKVNSPTILNQEENKEENSSKLENFRHIPLKNKINFLGDYDVYSGKNHFNNHFLRDEYRQSKIQNNEILGTISKNATPPSLNGRKDSVLFDYPLVPGVDSNEDDGVLDEHHENKITRLGKIAINASLLQFIATGIGFRSFNFDTSDVNYTYINPEIMPNLFPSEVVTEETAKPVKTKIESFDFVATEAKLDEYSLIANELGGFGNGSAQNKFKSITPVESPAISSVSAKPIEFTAAESLTNNTTKTKKLIKVKIIYRFKQAIPNKTNKKASEDYSYGKKNASKFSSKMWDKKYYNKFQKLYRRERNALPWPDELFRKREPQHIVGGWVENQPWPWMVAIYDDSNNKFVCGGTLIDDLHILSAAHCFIKFSSKKKMSVVIGSLARLEVQGRGSDAPRRHRVRRVYLHEGFVPECYCNDIAILKLRKSVGPDHVPACLPERDPAGVGENTTILGWGDTNYGNRKSKGTFHLNRLDDVTITDPEECRKIMSRIAHMTLPKNFTEYYICAGSQEGKDACSGDSGGPLMHEDYDGIWSVIGVVSFGFKCGEAGVPGTYSKISYFLPWIRSTIQSGRI